MTSWTFLLAASAFEILMAYALKASHSFSRPLPAAIGVAAALLSIYLLARAVRDLPLGTAYAVWTGLGAVGVAGLGVLFLGESLSATRAALLLLVIGGTAGLRLFDA